MMAETVTAAESRMAQAVPTFARGLRAIARSAAPLWRWRRRLLIAVGIMALLIGGLWLRGYNSLERQALRRVSALRGWTSGPLAAGVLVDRLPSSFLTRLIGRIPSAKVVTGLVLEGRQPTDGDLELFVAAFPRIEQLDISSTPMTDQSLDDIGRLPMLSMFAARHTALTDAGIRHLAGLRQLLFVELDDTRITDAALADLATLPRMCRLSVAGTAVTDSGIALLPANQLLLLNVSDTQVTDAGVAAFQAANPRCQVVR